MEDGGQKWDGHIIPSSVRAVEWVGMGNPMKTLCYLLSAVALGATLDLFPPVPSTETNPYPRGVAQSTRYRVMVIPAGLSNPTWSEASTTATYRLWPDYVDPETLPSKHAKTAVHVAQVDSDERVRVRVELMDGDTIETLRLKPTRLTELAATQQQGRNWVEFEVEPYKFTRSVLVEINAPDHDADALQDGLVFMLNPLSVVPDGRVMRLPAGVIDERSPFLDELNRLYIPPDSPYDAIYIPADTIVDGRVDVRKPGFIVTGRGMIIGSRWPFAKSTPNWRERYPAWISPDGERVRPLLSYKSPTGSDENEAKFEGVLVAHPYHFCVGWADHNENLKTFGWRYSSDGIHGLHKRGSFMRVNDDATYFSEGSIEDCTYWGMVNGAVFQLGWGLSRDNDRPVHVRRIDVVRGEWDVLPNPGQDGLGSPTNILPSNPNQPGANRGVFIGTFRSGGPYTVRNKVFEDVRIDTRVNRLFYFGSRTEEVSYENFVFKDIWFEAPPYYEDGVENVLRGKEQVGGFIFENFMIGDEKVDRLEDLEPLNQRNLEGTVFR